MQCLRAGEECHTCEHLSKRVMLGASFSIMEDWHCMVAGEPGVLCVGGVWIDPSNIPDGAGGWDAHNCPSMRPRGPEHSVLWNGKVGIGVPSKEQSANTNSAGKQARISWYRTDALNGQWR